jgi:hypothetical protein
MSSIEEVSPEVQAQLALKLSESIQDLVREEIKKAMQDTSYVSQLANDYTVVSNIRYALKNNYNVREQTKEILQELASGLINKL